MIEILQAFVDNLERTAAQIHRQGRVSEARAIHYVAQALERVIEEAAANEMLRKAA